MAFLIQWGCNAPQEAPWSTNEPDWPWGCGTCGCWGMPARGAVPWQKTGAGFRALVPWSRRRLGWGFPSRSKQKGANRTQINTGDLGFKGRWCAGVPLGVPCLMAAVLLLPPDMEVICHGLCARRPRIQHAGVGYWAQLCKFGFCSFAGFWWYRFLIGWL